jgi:hypothetical protein
MSKRRTPPLFEVLSGPDRRSGAAGPTVRAGRGPVRVEVPQPQHTDAAGTLPGQKTFRVPLSVMCIAAGVLLALFFGGWAIVYQLGARQKETDLAQYLDTRNAPPTPAGTAAATPMPPPAMYHAEATPGIDPGPAAPPATGTDEAAFADPRKPGMNYLHIATMSWKDAEKAVAYLNKNGIAAAAAPAKPVDPSEARAKNLPHIVFAVDGVASDQFKATAARRQSLEERVRSLGKRWQREEHGPSDFGQPGWSKYK